MPISQISYGGADELPDIPEWINRPHERRKQNENIKSYPSQAQTVRSYPTKESYNQYQGRTSKHKYHCDTFVSSKGKRAAKSKINPKALIAAIAAAISIVGGSCSLISNLGAKDTTGADVTPMPAVVETQTQGDRGTFMGEDRYRENFDFEPVESEFIDEEEPETLESSLIMNDPAPDETPIPYGLGLIEDEYIGSGKSFLDELETLGGPAPQNYYKLCDTLYMTEEETADYLTQLCESADWADGCTTPKLLFAQLSRENGTYNPTRVGDGGAAIGISQFHKCAVDEVNKQYGTNYTYDDRNDPYKSLEMMTLLLKYDYKRTGSTYGMLAMYNQGHPALHEKAGKAYVDHVLAQIGLSA